LGEPRCAYLHWPVLLRNGQVPSDYPRFPERYRVSVHGAWLGRQRHRSLHGHNRQEPVELPVRVRRQHVLQCSTT
ncbi:hypothetical protein HK405_002718, partial [Cladochytrium tenue]